MAHPLISKVPGNPTCKYVMGQGWNAAQAGFAEADCPYYATSSYANAWLKGFRRGMVTVRRQDDLAS